MKRIVLSAFLLLLCFGVFSAPALAQEAIPNKATIDQNIIDDSSSGNVSLDSWNLRYDTSKMANIGMFITGVQDETGNPVVRGVIPTMGQSMAYMIGNPPASTEIWLADLFQNSPFLGEKAYAQGVGFSSLNPILPVWKVFRDLAYSAFVIIFVIIGFMIMFRRKLGAQTVVTITSALPTIVITLLLITFSYAICGLIIDLMYLSIYFIIGIFAPLLGGHDLRVIAFDNNIFENGLKLIFDSGNKGAEIKESVVGTTATALGDMVSSYFSGTGGFIKSAFGVATSVVGYVIISVALFYAVIKLFFELLKSYVTFLIGVVFSPIQLLLAGFKGNAEFVQWFKNMAGALVPFPVVIGMIFLAMVFGGQSSTPGVGFQGVGDKTDAFQAPQISLGTSSVGAVQGLIALGVLMLIPEAVKLSKEWVGVKSPFEKELGMINANLQKGWKGGQLIDGIGPSLPGAGKLVGTMAKSTGGAIGLGALGAAGGGIGGAAYGYREARKEGNGRIMSAIAGGGYGITGATAGGLGGALVGGLYPIAAPAYKAVSPTIAKITKGTERVNSLGQKARNIININTGTNDAKASAATNVHAVGSDTEARAGE